MEIEQPFPDTELNDLDTVSKRLKYIITKSGIKQTHIAKKLGVTRGAIHYILNNESKNPRSAQKIADLLGVDSDWLYTGKSKNQPDSFFDNPEQKSNITANVIPCYYLDQLLMQQQKPDISITPTGEVIAQRTYQEKTFAVQLSCSSVLQKFEAGDIIIFTQSAAVSPGDWILCYRPQEERLLFGVVVFADKEHIALLHHKLEQPILLNLKIDDIMGTFVESVRYKTF